MIITLIITTIFLSLSLFMFHSLNISDEEIENEFWKSFNAYWQQTVENSKYYEEISHIYIVDRKVVFSTEGKKMYLAVPKSLSTPLRYLITIKSDGYVAPGSYNWLSRNRRVAYQQRIQLGWGIYRIYEQKY